MERMLCLLQSKAAPKESTLKEPGNGEMGEKRILVCEIRVFHIGT
jgi:hypothetical protein